MNYNKMNVPIEIVQEFRNMTGKIIVEVEVKEESIPQRDGKSLLGLFPVFLILLMVIVKVSWSLYKSFEMLSLTSIGLFCVMLVPILSYIVYLMFLFLVYFARCFASGQKTRNTPQRRGMYVGSRQRPSLTAQEPTIYVSPNNLPPPPKYECMAPPSYEEVVGIHYPNYPIQPIAQPINAALAQSSSNTTTTDSVVVTTVNENAPVPITAATELRRTSLPLAR